VQSSVHGDGDKTGIKAQRTRALWTIEPMRLDATVAAWPAPAMCSTKLTGHIPIYGARSTVHLRLSLRSSLRGPAFARGSDLLPDDLCRHLRVELSGQLPDQRKGDR
jgi:hypothetical protein